jgi:hypothetical protein
MCVQVATRAKAVGEERSAIRKPRNELQIQVSRKYKKKTSEQGEGWATGKVLVSVGSRCGAKGKVQYVGR